MKFIEKTNKLWVAILEVVFAVIYALKILYSWKNAAFRMNGYAISTVIEFASCIAFVIAIYSLDKNNEDRVKRGFVYIYAFLLAMDTSINDSLVALVFIGIIFGFLMEEKDKKNRYNLTIRVALIYIVGMEIASIMAMGNFIQTDSIMLQSFHKMWINIILVVVIVLQFLTEKNVKPKPIMHKIIPFAAVIVNIGCVVVLGLAVYFRINDYAITAKNIKEGTIVYIEAASNVGNAIECSNNILSIKKTTNVESQMFRFEKSEEDGYWHIYTREESVFDVCNMNFDENNTVIAWEENGVEGQHWTVKDEGDNLVSFLSHDENYLLSWDDDDFIIDLTTDKGNPHNLFFLKNAATVNKSFTGWIVNSNKLVVIIIYEIAMALITIIICAKVIRRPAMKSQL